MKYLENKFVENSRIRAEIEEKNKEIYTFQPNAGKPKRNSSRENLPSVNYKNYEEYQKYKELRLKEKYYEPDKDYTFTPKINKK